MGLGQRLEYHDRKFIIRDGIHKEEAAQDQAQRNIYIPGPEKCSESEGEALGKIDYCNS